jgi:hypothetical protein
LAAILFSVLMATAHDLEALLGARFGAHRLRFALDEAVRSSLVLDWPGFEDVLPDRGLPKGVVELTAPHALGGSTRVALSAVRAGQARGAEAWCAWIDPESTLHAPGVVAAGVDLERMLVVRAPREELGRVAVKIVGAAAFEVVVIDFDAVPQELPRATSPMPAPDGRFSPAKAGKAAKQRAWPADVLVRKLAVAAESGGATVLLLTDSRRPRTVPWPVALRIELERQSRTALGVRIAKDKRARIGLSKTVPFVGVR